MTESNLGAFVKTSFNKGFMLDEERLRKINNILTERCIDFGEEIKPEYSVYRADNSRYLTESIEQIIHEENSDWNKIVKITISVEKSDSISLVLDFDSQDDPELSISGKNRDKVFLLSSDIGTYLSNEVFIVKTPLVHNKTISLFIPAVFGLIPFFIFLLIPKPSESQIPREAALASSDIQVKLDFLIKSQSLNSSSVISYSSVLAILLILVFIAILYSLSEKIVSRLKTFYPKDIFLFGKEIEKHKKRQDLKDKILWGIGITGIVGIATSLLVWYITSKR